MRVVIDTNVWVSGLLWQGNPWRLLRLAEQGHIELCITYSMLLELEEVLSYDRLRERAELLAYTPAQLASFALTLSTPFSITRHPVPIVENDHDDDVFVICAIEAEAEFLVTKDRHLLALRSYQGVSILDVDTFLMQEFGDTNSDN
jgi:putative PIN family toxin of toxin-antitoxin system